MMRTLISLMAVLGLASAASAATMIVDTDKMMYLPGDIITITSTLTVTGGEAPASNTLLELLWNDAQVLGLPGPASYPTALTSSGGFFVWLPGTGICLAASCLVLDQLSPVITGAVPDPATITMSLTMVANAIGPLDFSFGVTILFGATPTFGANAAAAEVIPEPGTAALLGLGLTGLAHMGRRRRSLGGGSTRR